MDWLAEKVDWLLRQDPAAVAVAALGWPALILGLCLTAAGIAARKPLLIGTAFVLVLPVSIYLAGANNWMAVAGPLIPVAFTVSWHTTRRRRLVIAWAFYLVPVILVLCMAYWILVN